MRQIVVVEGGGWGDVVTNHAAYFIHRDITELAKSKGWKEESGAEKRLVVLAGSKANRTAYEAAMGVDQGTIWVDGCGHGNETIFFCGYQNQPLMDRSNEQLARGKVFTIRSCSGGKDFQRRLDMDEIAEGSYVDTLWVCIDNQNNPAEDRSSEQFHRCFHEQSVGLLNGMSFRSSASEAVATYHRESVAPGTLPVNKFYLEIDFGVYQHQVDETEGWDWRVEESVEKKVTLSVDDVVAHEWPYVGAATYTWEISILEEGIHTLKAVDPEGRTAYVKVNIVKGESGISFVKPKDMETFQAGSVIAIEIRVT